VKRICFFRWQVLVLTVLGLLTLSANIYRHGSFLDVWLTRDQQAMRHYKNLEFPAAAEMFVDPMWKGAAFYASGQYEQAAEIYGRVPTAIGFFNRGNSLIKSRNYSGAIKAYELAVEEDPDWVEARENLELSRYVKKYIEETREQSDTGEESGIGADDTVYDNTSDRGEKTVVSRESAIEAQTAEKWMRSVNTEARDFLNTRFALEHQRFRKGG